MFVGNRDRVGVSHVHRPLSMADDDGERYPGFEEVCCTAYISEMWRPNPTLHARFACTLHSATHVPPGTLLHALQDARTWGLQTSAGIGVGVVLGWAKGLKDAAHLAGTYGLVRARIPRRARAPRVVRAAPPRRRHPTTQTGSSRPALTEAAGRPAERVPGHVCRVPRAGKFCSGAAPPLPPPLALPACVNGTSARGLCVVCADDRVGCRARVRTTPGVAAVSNVGLARWRVHFCVLR